MFLNKNTKSSNEESFTIPTSARHENDGNNDNQCDTGDPSTEEEEDNLFSCTVCFSDFPTIIGLQRHYIKHIVNKPFQCQKCVKSYFTANALEEHTVLHSTIKPYPCHLCQDSFPNESTYNEHLDTHYFPEFLCNACFKHFPKKKHLQFHERGHTSLIEGSLSFPCILCDIQFIYQRDLEDHMNEHEKVNLYTCDKCDVSFFYNYLLQRHQQEHNFKISCNACGECFSDKLRLNDHEHVHIKVALDSDNLLRFVCEICNVMFPLKAELETHYNEAHEANSRFQCSRCDKSFFFSYLCTRHKVTHAEFREHQCRLCQKKFKGKIQLAAHLRYVHTEKEVTCPLCDYKCNSKEKLKLHGLVHTTQKPFVCSFCGAAFKRNCNLQRHYMSHTNERPYKCETCGSCYTRSTGLMQHLKQHEVAPYGKAKKCRLPTCNSCGETFTSQVMLVRHKRIEHPALKRLYTCPVCSKVIRFYSSFRVHMRQHTGERPYTCIYCDRTFVQRQHLVFHHNFHHSDLDFVVNLPFKCAYCEKSCLLKRGLQMHHKRQHPSLEFKA